MKLLSLSIDGAQITNAGIPSGGYLTLSRAIGLFLELLIITAIILTFFFLLWGGFDWITSGGDKQKLQSARHKIVFAIIGLIIVFLAFFIVNVIGNLFDVSLLSPPAGGGGGGGPRLLR